MFSTEQKELMRPVLGNSYSGDVLEVLKDKGIKSRKGGFYKAPFIVNVFNGEYENHHIESAILEVYNNRLEEIKKLEWQKDQLLPAKSDTI